MSTSDLDDQEALGICEALRYAGSQSLLPLPFGRKSDRVWHQVAWIEFAGSFQIQTWFYDEHVCLPG